MLIVFSRQPEDKEEVWAAVRGKREMLSAYSNSMFMFLYTLPRMTV